MTANTTAMMWLLRKSECSSTLHRRIACKQEFVELKSVYIRWNQNSVADREKHKKTQDTITSRHTTNNEKTTTTLVGIEQTCGYN